VLLFAEKKCLNFSKLALADYLIAEKLFLLVNCASKALIQNEKGVIACLGLEKLVGEPFFWNTLLAVPESNKVSQLA